MAPARPPAVSGPEIRVAYGPAGRETLAAITEDVTAQIRGQSSSPDLSFEMAPAGRETLSSLIGEVQRPAVKLNVAAANPSQDRSSAAPDIEVREGPAGRETLAAIAEALGGTPPAAEPTTGVRQRLRTRGYSDIPEARQVSVGRDTLDALARVVAPEKTPESAVVPGFEVFEMATFVVRANDLVHLSSEAQRRAFVEERLMHRLPIDSPEDIDRVDVTPWTEKNTVVLRVWCRVRPA